MLAHEEHVDAVVALLEGGANPAEADAEGRTPLHEAAGWGHTAAIRVLVRAGADVGSKRAGGFTALHDAARMGRAEAIAALLELGAVADSPCDSLQTPLYLAAACKDQAAAAAAVRALLAGGASPNSRTVQGVTPLIAAATLAASQALLAGGADATLVDKRGNTALHAAAKRWARWEGGQTAPKKLHGDRWGWRLEPWPCMRSSCAGANGGAGGSRLHSFLPVPGVPGWFGWKLVCFCWAGGVL